MRPIIEIGVPGRTWQEVSPIQLSRGDIVPDHGMVEGAWVFRMEVVGATPGLLVDVEVTFLSGEVYTWKATDRIKAFTTGDSPWPGAEEYLRGHRF